VVDIADLVREHVRELLYRKHCSSKGRAAAAATAGPQPFD